MIIVAKFASVCPCCSQRIQPGSRVEWSKGAPAKHTACAQGPSHGPAAVLGMTTVKVADMPRRRYSGSRGRWTGCSCGSREDSAGDLIDSPKNCSSCVHDSY